MAMSDILFRHSRRWVAIWLNRSISLSFETGIMARIICAYPLESASHSNVIPILGNTGQVSLVD